MISKHFEKNVYGLIAELKQFDYTIQSIDLIWDVIFPHKTARHISYHYIRVTKYRDTFYIGHIDGELCALEIRVNTSVQAAPSFGSSHKEGDPAKGWDDLITSARNWLKIKKRTGSRLTNKYGYPTLSIVAMALYAILSSGNHLQIGAGSIMTWARLKQKNLSN